MGKHEAYEGDKENKTKTKSKNNGKKANEQISKFGLVCRFILILSSLYLMYESIKSNILPLKYIAVLLAVIVVINVVEIIVLIKNKKNRALKTLTGLLALVISFVFIYGALVFRNGMNFLQGLDRGYKTLNFSVIVKVDSEYDKIEDLENKTMGYLNNGAEGMNESIKAIEDLDEGITLVPYENLQEMGEELLEGNVDSILLEDSFKAMIDDLDVADSNASLEDEEEDVNTVTKTNKDGSEETVEKEEKSISLENFEEDTKVIYTFTVTVGITSIAKDVSVTEETFNVYISGIDKYGDISSVSRSDVNIVATINPSTKQVLLTSIPRDYYVQLHGTTGYPDKLTHAGVYGVDKSVATIEDLLDIEINYYFKFNFTSVIEIVNEIGGVDVYSDHTFTSKDGYHYQKGLNSVDGKAALSFVRERKAFKDGDRQRGRNQQAMIDAIAKKCMKPNMLAQYNSLLKAVQDCFVTNMPAERISSLVKMQLDTGGDWTISSNSLTGRDARAYTYSYSGQALYVMVPYQESIDNAKEMIQKVVDGEILDGSSYEYTGDSYTVVKMNVPTVVEDEKEDEEEEEEPEKEIDENLTNDTNVNDPNDSSEETNSNPPNTSTGDGDGDGDSDGDSDGDGRGDDTGDIDSGNPGEKPGHEDPDKDQNKVPETGTDTGTKPGTDETGGETSDKTE